MATPGEQFKAAREAKGVTKSEAGKATRILTKIIRAMEADDFSAMPAPTYAKGFIRLYAEYLGIDPAPLVEDYLANHASSPQPLLKESNQFKQGSRVNLSVSLNLKDFFVGLPRAPLIGKVSALFSRVRKQPLSVHSAAEPFRPAGMGMPQTPPPEQPRRPGGLNLKKERKALPVTAWKDVRIIAGAVAALFILIVLISSLSSCPGRPTENPAPQTPQTDPARMLIDDPIPDLYLVEPGKIEAN